MTLIFIVFELILTHFSFFIILADELILACKEVRIQRVLDILDHPNSIVGPNDPNDVSIINLFIYCFFKSNK